MKSIGVWTTAVFSPASSMVWSIAVVTGGIPPGEVCPGEPAFALNSGENGTPAQLVGVYEAWPVTVVPGDA